MAMDKSHIGPYVGNGAGVCEYCPRLTERGFIASNRFVCAECYDAVYVRGEKRRPIRLTSAEKSTMTADQESTLLTMDARL